MRFTKMHGLGNDFIMIDCLTENPDLTEIERGAPAICDRRFGIGADGIIFVMPSRAADFRMRVINSDGSEAEMCGNGIRCVAKYIYDRGLGNMPEMTVETLAGTKVLQLEARNGKVDRVRVDMGAPELRRNAIPMTGADSPVVKDQVLRAGERDLAVTCLSMGNPHCVTFVDDVASYPVAEVGPKIERHEVFPRRTNVEFAQTLGPAEIRMRVWERGVGETLACGTGACATAVASALNGRTSRKVLVHLSGGDLDIQWADDNRVWMTGPATTVFEGEFEPGRFV
ncbi:MAG: diaminopimelate epimerase [Armatimonadota bacterium]|nr:diaminopimelate epimerase [Armatimonadota bacterium]